VLVVENEQADVVVFGTGASQKDGKIEAEYIVEYLFESWERLTEFQLFQTIRPSILRGLRDRMERIARRETISKRTAEEVVYAGRIFQQSGVEKVVLVSSADHTSRCLRDATAAYEDDEFKNAAFRNNLFATPAHTSYTEDGVARVEILEPIPPGQGRPLPPKDIVEAYYRIPSERKTQFLTDLDQLLTKHGAT
jgi:hypothetical protein